MKSKQDQETPINLDDHIIHINTLDLEVVPLSIAKRAVEQASMLETVRRTFEKLEESLEGLEKSVGEVTNNQNLK